MSRPIVYLAAPYSHADMAVIEARVAATNRAAGELIATGLIVFSPISMTHAIAMVMGNHADEMWYGFDEPFMEVCERCVVLTLDGWSESRGVTAEIEWFRSHGRDVSFLQTAGR